MSGGRVAGGLIPGALRTVAVRGLDLPSRYGFHLLVAAALGVERAGQFYIVYSVMTALGGLGRLGVDRALTRHLAMAGAHGDSRPVRPLLRRALMLVALLSALVSLLLYAAAAPFAQRILGKPDLATPLALAALTILPQNASTVMAGALAGLHRVGQSQMIYSWLWPCLFCLTALITGLDLNGALVLIALSFLLVALVGGALLIRALPSGGGEDTPPFSPRHGLLHEGASLFTLEMTQLVIAAAPALILGILASDSQVGLFALAWRIALLVNIVVSGIAAMASPRYAALHARQDMKGLNRAAAQAIVLSLGLSVLPVAVMLAVPAPLLDLFGQGYAGGAPVLRILALGQLAAALSASMPELLGMTGHMKSLRRLNSASLAVLLVGAAALAHGWGAAGTAWAVALSITVNGLGALALARRDLNLSPWRAIAPKAG